jgi:hypothetical protein
MHYTIEWAKLVKYGCVFKYAGEYFCLASEECLVSVAQRVWVFEKV